MQVLLIGKPLLPNITLKLILLVLLVINYLLRREKLSRKIMVPWLIFACYLLVSSAYLLFHLKYPLSLVAYGFNTYYFYILLLPLLPSLRGMISAELIKKIFIFLGISLLLLSLIQHITDSMFRPIHKRIKQVSDTDVFIAPTDKKRIQDYLNLGLSEKEIISYPLANLAMWDAVIEADFISPDWWEHFRIQIFHERFCVPALRTGNRYL